jgi:hypothetical protein
MFFPCLLWRGGEEAPVRLNEIAPNSRLTTRVIRPRCAANVAFRTKRALQFQ